jgi:hypothetical protein
VTHTTGRLVAAVALTATVAGTAAFAAWPPDQPTQPTPVAASKAPTGLQPCRTEDDKGPCYWDAKARGNKEGRSFTRANGQTRYWMPDIRTWRANMKANGFHRLPDFGYGECWALDIGPADNDEAVAVCTDGWVELS